MHPICLAIRRIRNSGNWEQRLQLSKQIAENGWKELTPWDVAEVASFAWCVKGDREGTKNVVNVVESWVRNGGMLTLHTAAVTADGLQKAGLHNDTIFRSIASTAVKEGPRCERTQKNLASFIEILKCALVLKFPSYLILKSAEAHITNVKISHLNDFPILTKAAVNCRKRISPKLLEKLACDFSILVSIKKNLHPDHVATSVVNFVHLRNKDPFLYTAAVRHVTGSDKSNLTPDTTTCLLVSLVKVQQDQPGLDLLHFFTRKRSDSFWSGVSATTARQLLFVAASLRSNKPDLYTRLGNILLGSTPNSCETPETLSRTCAFFTQADYTNHDRLVVLTDRMHDMRDTAVLKNVAVLFDAWARYITRRKNLTFKIAKSDRKTHDMWQVILPIFCEGEEDLRANDAGEVPAAKLRELLNNVLQRKPAVRPLDTAMIAGVLHVVDIQEFQWPDWALCDIDPSRLFPEVVVELCVGLHHTGHSIPRAVRDFLISTKSLQHESVHKLIPVFSDDSAVLASISSFVAARPWSPQEIMSHGGPILAAFSHCQYLPPDHLALSEIMEKPLLSSSLPTVQKAVRQWRALCGNN
eukprot:TRINITY_DN19251_c0_g1_i1.p1 TRINITY_DN19251_c0_g1~~TRINITY_DN19251_c0_g1_i1.p1  ORF type:complete len:584 (+),score=45.82 TRINITY_DN19251_c0_g1_i1:30-1781(+)